MWYKCILGDSQLKVAIPINAHLQEEGEENALSSLLSS